MHPSTCLTCGSSPGIGFHLCASKAFVLHPEVLRESRATANPLDNLPVGDMLKIYGEDPDEIAEDAERRLQESNEQYLWSELTYRVELQSVSGLGFQGGIDCWAIEAAGRTDGDLTTVLDFLNSKTITPLSLRQDEIYLCRLVSLDRDGIRHVWITRRLYFDGIWKSATWT